MRQRIVTAFGETKPMKLWLRDPRCAVSSPTVYKRLNEGMTIEQAISTQRAVTTLEVNVGDRNGRATIIKGRFTTYTEHGYAVSTIICRCDCGTEFSLTPHRFSSATNLSCGCNARKRGRKPKPLKEKREAQRQWRIKNRARRRIYIREWKRRNPGRVASHQESRNEIRRWSETDDDRINAIYHLARSEEIVACYLCGMDTTRSERDVEHKTPKCRGGEHIADNLGIACKGCNGKKGRQTEAEFRARCP